VELQRVRLGDFELVALRDGFFRLDGGSMFGVIPKPLWERKKPADERNRIHLGLNCLLVKTPNLTALIEAGIGDKLTAAAKDINGLERTKGLPAELEAEGVTVDDIDFVILSHLHLDHCGWSTVKDGDSYRPTFPGARYVIQESEWQAAIDPDRRSKASYDRRDFEPLEGHKGLSLVNGEAEIAPGIKIVRTGGHTYGHQIVILESGRARCIFLGDLVPTTAHLKVNWHMGWDLFPLDLMRVKEKILTEAALREDLLFFTHEDGEPFAQAREILGGIEVR
jgi:glyoxylase-like metal-dependent hydrolase (beta-lactamase superfamily II)